MAPLSYAEDPCCYKANYIVSKPATSPSKIIVIWDENETHEALTAVCDIQSGSPAVWLSDAAQPATLEFLADLAKTIEA